MYIEKYKYGYHDEEPAVFVEMYMDQVPAGGLPMNTDNLSPLKPGYKFMTGSLIYIVATGALYMYKADSEEWVQQ